MPNNNFKFEMNIAKAETNTEGKMLIKGLASGLQRDRQDERFSEEGILSMKKAIEDGIVDEDGNWSEIPLRNAHQKEWDADLGWVTKGEIDEDHNLWITAELDEDNPDAVKLYKSLTRPKRNGRMVKLGLSVQGAVSKYRKVFDPEISKSTLLFDAIRLNEISVTRAPVYPTPYFLAIAKSLLAEEEDTTMTSIGEVVNNDGIEVEAVKADADEVIAEVATEVVAEEVTKSEEDVTEDTVTDSEPEVTQSITLESLADQLKQLSTMVLALHSVEKSETVEAPTEEVATLESESATLETDVQKSESGIDLAVVGRIMDEKITEAFGAVLTTFAEFSNKIDDISKSLKEIEAAPADKSIAVRKAKEEQTDDFSKLYEKYIKEGQSPITASVRAQFEARQ